MFSLLIPAFLAGILTFLAPCTLPLVPGYLVFISGVSLQDLNDRTKQSQAKRRIIFNSLFYILGFSFVFIGFGVVFGGLGGFIGLVARQWLARIGGLFVLLMGLSMMHVFSLPAFGFLKGDRLNAFGRSLTPGKPLSSFLLGAIFALGWTPCIGPVLGSVLLLVSAHGTVVQGAFLLGVFSLGLGAPFLLIALAIGHATKWVRQLSKYLNVISVIGGLFLVFLGGLMLFGQTGLWFGLIGRVLHAWHLDVVIDHF